MYRKYTYFANIKQNIYKLYRLSAISTYYDNNNWSIIIAKLFTRKEEALKYGKEIARNKGTDLIVYQQDETVETTIHYGENN